MALKEAAIRAWQRHPLPRPQRHELFEIEQQRRQFELVSDPLKENTVLTRHQSVLVVRCDSFLRHFPTSRYALNVLYIKARALDMRVDADEFRVHKWIRFYDSFPSAASRETWETILKNGPNQWASAVARLQLARLEAQEGKIDRAVSKLSSLITRFGGARVADGATPPHPDGTGMLGLGAPDSGLPINCQRVVLEANALRDLLRNNRDPIYGNEPLSGPTRPGDHFKFGFLDLDPHDERYVHNLRELKRRYVNCQLRDNIDLAIAKSTTRVSRGDAALRSDRGQPRRIALLRALLVEYPQGDAVPEALYRLSEEQLLAGDADEAGKTARLLAENHANSVWARQSSRYHHRFAAHSN